MSYYRGKRKSYKKKKGHEAAINHIIARQNLSRLMGGIDKDVEEIFFNLPDYKLSELLYEYGRKYGDDAESYARQTLPSWQSIALNIFSFCHNGLKSSSSVLYMKLL